MAVQIVEVVAGIPGFIILWRLWHRARKQQIEHESQGIMAA